MKTSSMVMAAGCVLVSFGTWFVVRTANTASSQGAANAAPPAADSANRQAEFGQFPERPFTRQHLDRLTWSATEGNILGVQSAVVEGDPSKPGFYLIINRFPPGVMSRPHTHPDERHGLVLKGTWYTGEGQNWTPERGVGLKPGDYIRHPAGGLHWDGALDEEVLVALSGYGPTSARVHDGGDLFGRTEPSR